MIFRFICWISVKKEARRIKKERKEEARRIKELKRKYKQFYFKEITEEEFKELVNSVWRSLRTKRIINVNVKKAIVTGSVVSQSGISDWSFRLDFNYYGELCGKYRIFSDNPDSNIPKHFGDAIGIEIQNTLTKKRLKHKK